MSNPLEAEQLGTERDASDVAKARIAELEAELERFKANANVGICLWCSDKVARDAEAIREHLVTCPAHPMRALEREVRRLRALLDVEGGE